MPRGRGRYGGDGAGRRGGAAAPRGVRHRGARPEAYGRESRGAEGRGAEACGTTKACGAKARPVPVAVSLQIKAGAPPARQNGLADLDQIPVGVADVAADLGRVPFRRREELGTPCAPVGVHRLDVRDPDVHEAGGPGWILRCLERDRGLVVGRATADVDDDPGVGERDIRWFARYDGLAAEHLGVEAAGPFDVGNGDELRDGDLIGGGGGLRRHGGTLGRHRLSPPEKISRKNRKTFRMSRKIEAAISGASVTSAFLRTRWKSNMVNRAKITRPSTE